MRKRKWGFVLSLLVILCLSACSNKSAAVAQNAVSDYGPAMTAETNVPVSPDSQYENGEEEKAVTSLAGETGSGQVLPAGRKLIRNISMNVETDGFETLLHNLQTRITQLGGYVEQSDMTGSRLDSLGKPVPRYANMTIRIPVNQIDSFISTVETNGNITDKSESTQDVTLQYSDLESRKKSLEVEQEKLWEFLQKAESIDTVITLQQRLSEIRYQLESMESQLKLYDNQVNYGTVSLSIWEVTTFTPTAPESAGTRIRNGFAGNLKLFKSVLLNLTISAITTSPFWLPIAAAASAIFFYRRRKKKKRLAISPPMEEKEPSGTPRA